MTQQAVVMERAQVQRVSTLIRDLVRRDVAALSEEDFLGVFDDVATLGRLASALQARVAGDLARRSTPELPGGGLARRQGFGNAASMVASVTGGSTAGAWRFIEVGQALMPEPVLPSDLSDQGQHRDPAQAQAPAPAAVAPRFPAIAVAVHGADLSVEVAAIITAGLESLTDRVSSDQLHALEQHLVDKAVGLGVREVRRLVAAAVARADLAGHVEREQRHHAARYVTWTEDHTGMVTLSGRLDAVTAAPLRTVIEQMVTHQIRARRDQDPTERDQRTVGQMRADALRDLARHSLGCKNTNESGIRTTIIVRMNLADLTAGEGLGSIDGTAQPVSVGELRRLAGEAGIIPQVLGGDSEILDVGRRVRMFTKTQRLALLERDGGCAKCHAPPEHCEAHHIKWWEHGGRTDLNNGVMLCTRCHHDIHRQGWGIHIRDGQVSFIPPPDIDPLQRPRLGGIAAITIDGPGEVSELAPTHGNNRNADDEMGENPAREASDASKSPRKNSASDHPTWENSARNAA